MKRTGIELPLDLRRYLLTLDNNTIYPALANQGHGKTENAYWKGITAMRAEPNHRWNTMWFNMWQRVSYEVAKLPKPEGTVIPAEALKDIGVQAALKSFRERSRTAHLLQEIQREVEKKVHYLRTFSSFPEDRLRTGIYTCLYIHCPFKVPSDPEGRLEKLVNEGYGEAFLALVKRFNDWQPLPLEFS